MGLLVVIIVIIVLGTFIIWPILLNLANWPYIYIGLACMTIYVIAKAKPLYTGDKITKKFYAGIMAIVWIIFIALHLLVKWMVSQQCCIGAFTPGTDIFIDIWNRSNFLGKQPEKKRRQGNYLWKTTRVIRGVGAFFLYMCFRDYGREQLNA